MTEHLASEEAVETTSGEEVLNAEQRAIQAAEETAVVGMTAAEIVVITPQVIQAGVEGVKAIDRVLEHTAESQKEAQATIRAAIDGKSDMMKTLAEKMESDDARIRLAELEIEREKEKTRQSEEARKANEDNNKTFRHGLNVIGYVVIGVVVLIFNGPKALAAMRR